MPLRRPVSHSANTGGNTATNVTVLAGARFSALGGSALVIGNVNNSGTLIASLNSGLMINGGLGPNGTAIAGITTINAGSSISADFVRQNTLTVNGSGMMNVRAKASTRKKKSKRGKRHFRATPPISITSLTDMVTMLLVYLLKTFATNYINAHK